MRELETERLRLRPYGAGDLDLVAGLYADERVTVYTKLGRRSRVEAEAILGDYLDTWRAKGYGMRALFAKADDAFVGECGFFTHATLGEAALRYALHERYWGLGLMTEALTATLADAFENRGLERILSIVQVANDASHRLMRKVGMEVERRARDGEVPLLVYALSADRWRARRPSPDPAPPG